MQRVNEHADPPNWEAAAAQPIAKLGNERFRGCGGSGAVNQPISDRLDAVHAGPQPKDPGSALVGASESAHIRARSGTADTMSGATYLSAP